MRTSNASLCVGLLFLCMYASFTVEVSARKTLVLHDKENAPSSFSQFFSTLSQQGHELSYLEVQGSSKVELFKYGEALYDNIVLFAPSVSFTQSNPSMSTILKFIDDGHNALVAVDGKPSASMVDFAQECGLKLDSPSSRVVDYFSHQGDDANKVLTSGISKNQLVVGSSASKNGKVLFEGTSHQVVDQSLLSVAALVGEASTSLVLAKSKGTTTAMRFGSKINLVTALQFRNNARVVFSGSIKMFSDEFISPSTSNLPLVSALGAWAYGDSGVLRVSNVRHHRKDGTNPETQLKHTNEHNLPRSSFPYPEIAPNSLVYRIQDDVIFSCVIEEKVNGQWVAYQGDDVQMEFVMLDPYVREYMQKANDTSGTYSLSFKIPDVYGVYKFRVMYRRPGYSQLNVEEQVSIRPFRHNEYERFIVAAMPYYTSAFTMMVGFFVFVVFFLSTKE